MPVELFTIRLHKLTALYNPGEKVTGEVVLKLSETLSCRGIRFNITGKTDVSWCHASGGLGHHVGTEQYFDVNTYILGSSRDTTELTPGDHVFPFTFTLPKNIPNSFEHDYGTIRYRLTAYIDKPCEMDSMAKVSFIVHTPLDLTLFMSRPIIGEINKTYCYYLLPCVTKGFMYAKVRISSNTFYVGDHAEALIAMDNSGSVDVTNIHMALKQRLTFYTSTTVRSSKRKIKVLQMVSHNGPFCNDRTAKLKMKIPNVPDTGLRNCQLIDLSYYINVTIVTSGCQTNESRDYEILIASKPLASTPENLRRNLTTSSTSPVPSIRTHDTPLSPISEISDFETISTPLKQCQSVSVANKLSTNTSQPSRLFVRIRIPSPSTPFDSDEPPSYESVVSEAHLTPGCHL